MVKCRFEKTFALIIILFLILTSFYPNISSFSSKEEDFDDDISTLLKNAKIPSMSTCIIQNESLVWCNGYGKYNKLLDLTPSEDTVYMAASVSKSFTATAIMQLYEDGLFELEEDVNNYLPFVLRNPNYPDVPITFKMLLSHQSSLSNNSYLILFGIVYLFFQKYFPYPALEWHLVPGGRMYHADVWTDNRPEDIFNYSNTGYLILEYLVE